MDRRHLHNNARTGKSAVLIYGCLGNADGILRSLLPVILLWERLAMSWAEQLKSAVCLRAKLKPRST